MTTAHLSDTFALGGDLPVHRLGYGAMQITGPGVWGEPADRPGALAVVRAAIEQGVDFIDTADSYGPQVSEQIIAEAAFPYPDGLVIATKAGLTRTGPGVWPPCGRPEYLTQQVELSLRNLKVDRIDLIQLHRIDPQVPLADQLGAFKKLQDEGKVRHIGVSEVSVEELRAAREVVDVVSVQNRYNVTDREHDPVLDYCSRQGIAFVPWLPIAAGDHAQSRLLAQIAAELSATPTQVSLAWLLHRSPVVVPIPGTRSEAHLHENVDAAKLRLSGDQLARLNAASPNG